MKNAREIILVAAMGRKRVIGAKGGMPWHLPADLKHFKSVTAGHPVLMGRRTFESIGRPLPGRQNIVVSRKLTTPPDGCELAANLTGALEIAGDRPAMVIGGGQLYSAALPLASRLELTFVDAAPDGDTYFPEWQHSDWRLAEMRVLPPGPGNEFGLVFCSLERLPGREKTS